MIVFQLSDVYCGKGLLSQPRGFICRVKPQSDVLALPLHRLSNFPMLA